MPRRLRLPVGLFLLVALAACGTTVPLSKQVSVPGAVSSLASTSSTGAGTGGSASTGAATGSTAGSLPSGSTGAGSGTSSVVSGSTGEAGGPASAAASGSIPTSGFGWDAKHFYIGMPTANDAAAAFKAAGANFDNGNIQGDVTAVVADINRSGGVLGRQLVPVFHDARTADVLANPAASAQEMCTYFTQDRPVIALINGIPQFELDTFHSCLESKRVSLLALTNTLYNDQDYRRLGPNVWTMSSLSTDRLVPAFLDSLLRQKFFTGWDTTNGRAGRAPVKVGILLPDDRTGHYVWSLMSAGLKRAGQKLASSFFYSPNGSSQSAQSEVLQFKAAGVTHVLNLPPVEADIGLFQTNAQQQNYRPRYGFTSFNIPLSIEENPALAPPAQQIGSIGIGFQPANDTDAAHSPGPMAGHANCLKVMTRGGQSFDASHRHAEGVAMAICDAFYALRDATQAGHGFSAAAVFAGMPSVGAAFRSATMFGSGFSTTSQGFPGYYRDEHYVTSCSCFVYTGGNRAFD